MLQRARRGRTTQRAQIPRLRAHYLSCRRIQPPLRAASAPTTNRLTSSKLGAKERSVRPAKEESANAVGPAVSVSAHGEKAVTPVFSNQFADMSALVRDSNAHRPAAASYRHNCRFASVIPAKASTGVVLPMLIVGDVVAVAYYRYDAEWKHLLRLFPWTIAGVLIGWAAMDRLADRQIRPLIGAIVLVMLLLNYIRSRSAALEGRLPSQWWFAAVMGLLAGGTTMIANAAGPIMVMYLLAMRLPKTAFIGTGAWYFLLMNCFKVPFSASLGLINASSLQFNLTLAPFVLAGAGAGIIIAKRIPEKVFNAVVQILAAVGAIKLCL